MIDINILVVDDLIDRLKLDVCMDIDHLVVISEVFSFDHLKASLEAIFNYRAIPTLIADCHLQKIIIHP